MIQSSTPPGWRVARHWQWAYRRIKRLECSHAIACYRATRYSLLGCTGYFFCNKGLLKVHLYRSCRGHDSSA
ncbi:hypothetical protein SAMN05216189_105121 [Pseudomonas delhiensis]|uniref:Uncharacterized protein n=1 Tax=Pseudomonas delhiensis TaxID=366289 RepID=A0A239NGM3_9PSED|nr:hypothetical protein SAMN05216189_105121 [Pseudomonas delhiensis]SNT54041.1 hypothetical protein SAMN06295949_1464 [Pseudomonas delhiensis]